MANFEIDSDLVRRLAEIAEGNAEAHARAAADEEMSEWSQHGMLAASSLVIAASYWSLIDARHAAGIYSRAAATYAEMGHDYMMVLALAALDTGLVERATANVAEQRESSSPQMVAFAMVGDAMTTGDDAGLWKNERLNAHWRHVGNVPVGRLGLPVDLYGSCADAMRGALRYEEEGTFVNHARQYVARAAEVIRAASHDGYHWNRLQSAILPAEPEAVAMTAAMSHVAQRAFRMPLREIGGELDAHARLLIDVGDSLRAATFGEYGPPVRTAQ